MLRGATLDDVWPKVRGLWAKACTVYRGPVGIGEFIHLEYAALEAILLRWGRNAEPALRSGLDDPSDMVAAYCIVGLGMLGEVVSPERFADRTRQLRWALCCMGGHMTLAELAESAGVTDVKTHSFISQWMAKHHPEPTGPGMKGSS